VGAGGLVTVLAQERGRQVTGLARAGDEESVRGLGADFTGERFAPSLEMLLTLWCVGCSGRTAMSTSAVAW
jgi:hypothetical protein